MKNVISGLEVLAATPELVGGRPWGLLANHAAVTAAFEPARAVLAAAGLGPLVRLFAPEHGLDGTAQDMEAVVDARDPVTGCEVRSLYGGDLESLTPQPDALDGLEVLLVDLPDIGSRYYTFAATMERAMETCARVGVELMVLDRPNPIGGVQREGGLVGPGFESFVSQLPVPARHGLSLGELALLLKRERHPSLELSVVPCRGWGRRWWLDESGLPWVPPSPNMPTLETAALYPGLCMVEATTLSEGRGTTRPFHLVGAPWADAERIAAELRGLALPGLAARAARFRPEFGKHAGAVCAGVELFVADRSALEPVALGLHLLRAFHDHDPEAFAWRREPYEFVDWVPALDLLTGSADARRLIENGASFEPLLEAWRAAVSGFEATLDGVLLHHDLG
jgi:uncharacterized protein YbbC (DUF1343 family)